MRVSWLVSTILPVHLFQGDPQPGMRPPTLPEICPRLSVL